MPISVNSAVSPATPAIIFGETNQTLSYKDLDETANRIANLLRQRGAVPGDGILIMMENVPAFFPIVYAARRAGLRYTTVSSRSTARELAYFLHDSEAKFFFTSNGQASAAQVRSDLTGVQCFVTEGRIGGFECLEDALSEIDSKPLEDHQPDGIEVLYTSGTTGLPKGVEISNRSARFRTTSATTMLRVLYQANTDTVLLTPAPFYHAAPLRFTMAALDIGGTVIAMKRFEPETCLRLIETHKITHAQFVPTMFMRLLKLEKQVRDRYQHNALRYAIHSSAPCPIRAKELMIEWWGPILYEYYAGTEANGLCVINSHEWLQKKGSVGRPIRGDIHVCQDDGEELPVNEIGTIFFGGGPSFQYRNAHEKTIQSTHPKGWTTLGDIGYVDGDGYLYLTDRRVHTIISGGVNIYPKEIEDVIVMISDIEDVAVFGIPNEDFGEEVKAVVQPRHWSLVDTRVKRETLKRKILEHCRAELADLKCPRTIDFVEALPREPSGKMIKRVLRDPYWAEERALEQSKRRPGSAAHLS